MNTDQLQISVLQQFLAYQDRNAQMTAYTNRKYEGELKRQGQSIDVPVLNDFNPTTGGSAGANIATKGTAVNKVTLTVNEIEQDGRTVGNLEELRTTYNKENEFLQRMAYSLKQQQERHVGLTVAQQVAQANVINYNAPVAVSDAYSTLNSMRTKLSSNNAFMNAVAFVDPSFTEKLRTNTNLNNAFKEGYEFRKTAPGFDGYVGKFAGFHTYETNNLPGKQTLTVDTNPTADDTLVVTLYDFETAANVDITFTFKASPAAAGEIDLGGSAAATQANIVLALNGTGTPGSSTYIEVSDAHRALLKNYRFNCSAFTSDVAVITYQSASGVTLSETFTAATNVFGNKGTVCLAWDAEAVNFVEQMTKFLVVPASSHGQGFYDKLMYESVFQAAVLGRNNLRAAAVETLVS